MNIVRHIYEEYSSKIKIRRTAALQIPKILANYEEIKQALLNIVKNNYEAMLENGGELEVQTRFQPADGGWIEILFIDQGQGIKKENLKHLFTPFFTTKLKGTGLGLPICHRIIVDRHQGQITIESQEGRGTRVTVGLPIRQGLTSRRFQEEKRLIPPSKKTFFDFSRGYHPTMKPTILVIDDDPNALFGISQLLMDEGYGVISANNGREALEVLKNSPIDVVVTDEKMPDLTGMELLSRVQQGESKPPVILITAYGSVSLAVEALKKGAFYFFEKPLFNNLDQFLAIVRQAVKAQAMARELASLRREVIEKYSFPNIIGRHPLMQELFEVIGRVAQTEKSVLIEGESGTGKDLIARTIHFNSLRRDHPLVSVNCGALTETLFTSEFFGHTKGAFTGAVKDSIGRFQAAEGGTLILEEIGEIPFHLQKTLLRVLEEREYERVGSSQPIKMDARILSTTNRNLREEVAKGNFREDLYYRISVVPLIIPPLRERVSDIPLLVHNLLKKFQEKGETVQG